MEILAPAIGFGLFCWLMARKKSKSTEPAPSESQLILQDPKYNWSDVLRVKNREIHFDTTNGGHNLVIRNKEAPALLPFEIIRSWGYKPLTNFANDHIGYRFSITTSNALDPILYIGCGRDVMVPDLWMAKFNAYLNK